MNLKEIVFRSDNKALTEDESLYVIKEYIKARKGVTVNPVIERGYGVMWLQQQYALMMKMLPYAIAWFRENLK